MNEKKKQEIYLYLYILNLTSSKSQPEPCFMNSRKEHFIFSAAASKSSWNVDELVEVTVNERKCGDVSISPSAEVLTIFTLTEIYHFMPRWTCCCLLSWFVIFFFFPRRVSSRSYYSFLLGWYLKFTTFPPNAFSTWNKTRRRRKLVLLLIISWQVCFII